MHCTEDSKDTLAGLVLLVENKRKKLWLGGIMVYWCLSSIMIPASSQLALATSCSLQLAEPILASTTSSPLKVVIEGQPYSILTTITGNCSKQEQLFVVIIEVRNSDGITEYLAWQNGILEELADKTKIGVSWVPAHADNYELRAFAINDFRTLEILSPLVKTVVTVNAANNSATDSDARKPFTIVLIPDTQNYWLGGNEELAYNQSKWIVKNKDTLNIKIVIHLGDIVNTWNSQKEWIMSDKMMKILDDNGIQYIALMGNHDFGKPYSLIPNRNYTYFEQYFPDSRIISNQTLSTSKITPDGGNNYTFLTVGKNEFLIVAMQYCPSRNVVEEVSKAIKQNADKRVILSTHAFLRSDGSWTSVSGGGVCTKIPGTDDYSTEAIWDYVVYPNPNVFLVVSGHSSGENKRIDNNTAGNPVQQVVIDYQNKNNGGDGMLKIITFDPEKDKVYFQTFSPWLNSYANGTKSKFTFDYEMN